MEKYKGKTEEEWSDLVDYWHDEYDGELTLPEFLGLDGKEYFKPAHDIGE